MMMIELVLGAVGIIDHASLMMTATTDIVTAVGHTTLGLWSTGNTAATVSAETVMAAGQKGGLGDLGFLDWIDQKAMQAIGATQRVALLIGIIAVLVAWIVGRFSLGKALGTGVVAGLVVYLVYGGIQTLAEAGKTELDSTAPIVEILDGPAGQPAGR